MPILSFMGYPGTDLKGREEDMRDYFNTPFEAIGTAAYLMSKTLRVAPKLCMAAFSQARAAEYYWSGMFRYMTTFLAPSLNSLIAFTRTEKEKLASKSPVENIKDYSQLLDMNIRLAATSISAGLKASNNFFYDMLSKSVSAWFNTFKDEDFFCDFAGKLEEVLKVTVREFPEAVDAIKAEFGFHLDNGGYLKVAETERFDLYQVLPTKKDITQGRKPILIIPPYVLGANILAFLPAEQRSYVHCFANYGVPTYIRLVKEIDSTPSVQTMTGEDDTLDIRFFCRELMARHNTQVTLNGFCQGGYLSLAAILSGELDGLVDALITCVTPVDGSRSKSLVNYLQMVPARFRDLKYSQKVLPDGNPVIDAAILSWVYKLQKLESDSPVVSFHRDINMFLNQATSPPKISKTAAGVNYWLTQDQKDIPVNICRMSFDSYTKPIDREGNLPVEFFGRKLNLKRLAEKNIPWLICIADGDDLVDKEASLAALDYIDAEVCVFPKGHASIATSWSIPTSGCALHLRFPLPQTPAPETCKMERGPVRFHADLEAAGTAVDSSKDTDDGKVLMPENAATVSP